MWQADYNRSHYQDLYFDKSKGAESLSTYYSTQSSGRYSVDGTVSDWVKVPYNEARYGREDATTWNLIQDGLASWIKQQHAAGKSEAQIKTALQAYDQYDRYDFDGDGDFNEPDGYLDHFQIVHAGGDEADGDPQQGEDAIWSHRWYAFLTDAGITGPAQNPLGGTQVGNTGLWVGDYTVQPENGGLSVFVHEYGHDLGLPDAYDTSGGGDNSNEYWTLMAQSRLNAKNEPLGTRPGDLGLGEAAARLARLRGAEHPPEEDDRARPAGVQLQEGPGCGRRAAQEGGRRRQRCARFRAASSSSPEAATTWPTPRRRRRPHGQDGGSMTAKVRYSIEEGYDYAYIQASTDGGANWTALDGTIDGAPIGADTSGRPGIDGDQESWADLNVPLGAYDGQAIKLRFYYKTDGGLALPGLFVDDVKIAAGRRCCWKTAPRTAGRRGTSTVSPSSVRPRRRCSTTTTSWVTART